MRKLYALAIVLLATVAAKAAPVLSSGCCPPGCPLCK